MAVRFQNNHQGLNEVVVDVTAELDNGAFLSVTLTDDTDEEYVDVADILLTSREQVDTFRREVNEACDEFLRLLKESNDG